MYKHLTQVKFCISKTLCNAEVLLILYRIEFSQQTRKHKQTEFVSNTLKIKLNTASSSYAYNTYIHTIRTYTVHSYIP